MYVCMYGHQNYEILSFVCNYLRVYILFKLCKKKKCTLILIKLLIKYLLMILLSLITKVFLVSNYK